MKSACLPLWSIAIFTLMSWGLCPPAEAQLNENKVKRDASGVYSGGFQAGERYFHSISTFDGSTVVDGPYDIPLANGTIRLPLTRKKSNSSVNDRDPGTDPSSCSGRLQKSTVKRGGERIVMKGNGSAQTHSEDGPWVNGKFSGDTKSRGKSWRAEGKCSASRYVVKSFAPDTPYTELVVGVELKGKH